MLRSLVGSEMCIRDSHVGFFKFQIFNGRTAEEGRTASLCQIWSKRSRDMAIFQFYKTAAAAILDFSNFKFLTVGRLKRAELRRRAKFGRNPSNRGRNMAIFRFFFKMAAAAILDFSNFKFLTVDRLTRAELPRHAKFGQNRSKRGGDIAIFRFFKMAAAAILDF